MSKFRQIRWFGMCQTASVVHQCNSEHSNRNIGKNKVKEKERERQGEERRERLPMACQGLRGSALLQERRIERKPKRWRGGKRNKRKRRRQGGYWRTTKAPGWPQLIPWHPRVRNKGTPPLFYYVNYFNMMHSEVSNSITCITMYQVKKNHAMKWGLVTPVSTIQMSWDRF